MNTKPQLLVWMALLIVTCWAWYATGKDVGQKDCLSKTKHEYDTLRNRINHYDSLIRSHGIPGSRGDTKEEFKLH